MFKYLMLALLFVSSAATAGYPGKNPIEVGKTADVYGYGYHFLSPIVGDYMVQKDPICAARSLLWIQAPDGEAIHGCWWKVGEQIYGYTTSTGSHKFNMDLLMVNDNFTGRMPEGF